MVVLTIYYIGFIACIDVVAFYVFGGAKHSLEKQGLFLVCLLLVTVTTLYEALFISIYRSSPMKLNAFSFEKIKVDVIQKSGFRLPLFIVVTILPIQFFYWFGQSTILWLGFILTYSFAILYVVYSQLQSIPQKAYAARFHLHQSLKGLK